MRAIAIINQDDSGVGVFGEELAARGWKLDEWRIHAGDPQPGDPLIYDAAFAFGGAMNTHQEDEFPWLRDEKRLLAEVLDRRIPVLGVCLGSQLLAEAAGAPAERSPEPEIGWYDVDVTAAGAEDPVIGALAPGFEAFQWHSYRSPLPPGATELARDHVGLQAFRIGENAWGIQFHAEVSAPGALKWAHEHDVDPDAVRIGIDPDVLSAEIRERIEKWNATGRALCGRFLDAAT